MRKNIILKTALAIAFILLVWNLVLLNRVYNTENQIQSIAEKNEIILNQVPKSYSQNFNLLLTDKGHLEVDGIENLDVILYRLLSKKKAILVYRYSDHHCGECIDFGMIKLHKLSEEMDNIIILASYDNDREMKISHRKYNSNIPICNVREGYIELKAEKMSVPYFFMVDSNMQISNVFIPEKTIPSMTTKYFNAIKSSL